MEANPQGTAEHIRASDLRRFNNDVRVRSAERFRRPAAAAAGDGRNGAVCDRSAFAQPPADHPVGPPFAGAETISPLRPATAAEAPAVSAAAAAAPPAAPAPSAAPPTLAGPGALPAPPVDAAPKGDASAPSSALKLPTDALDASNPSRACPVCAHRALPTAPHCPCAVRHTAAKRPTIQSAHQPVRLRCHGGRRRGLIARARAGGLCDQYRRSVCEQLVVVPVRLWQPQRPSAALLDAGHAQGDAGTGRIERRGGGRRAWRARGGRRAGQIAFAGGNTAVNDTCIYCHS